MLAKNFKKFASKLAPTGRTFFNGQFAFNSTLERILIRYANSIVFVIPAKAGIQLIEYVPAKRGKIKLLSASRNVLLLDSRLRGNDVLIHLCRINKLAAITAGGISLDGYVIGPNGSFLSGRRTKGDAHSIDSRSHVRLASCYAAYVGANLFAQSTEVLS